MSWISAFLILRGDRKRNGTEKFASPPLRFNRAGTRVPQTYAFRTLGWPMGTLT